MQGCACQQCRHFVDRLGPATPANVVEYISRAPAVGYGSPAPAMYAAPAFFVEYISPAPAVSYAAPAPAVYAVPAPVVGHISPAPAVSYAAPVPLQYAVSVHHAARAMTVAEIV